MSTGTRLTVAGCSFGANNGTFRVTSVLGAVVTLNNGLGVFEASPSTGTMTELNILRITSVAAASGGNTAYTLTGPVPPWVQSGQTMIVDGGRLLP